MINVIVGIMGRMPIKATKKKGNSMETTVYTRTTRSAFYLRVNEETEKINLFASDLAKDLINHFFANLQRNSPTGWQQKGKLVNLWIPQNIIATIKPDLERLKVWAGTAGSKWLWVKPSEFITGNFPGNHLECCVAGDFNSFVDTEGNLHKEANGDLTKSPLGLAEHMLKYEKPDEKKMREYVDLMLSTAHGCYNVLPLFPAEPVVISPIPAKDEAKSLSWQFAKRIAKDEEIKFLEPKLSFEKQSMKDTKMEDKPGVWETIYNTPNALSITAADVSDKTLVLIDDLYQSGTTMWAYATYLKKLGARRVLGLVCVKSMRDSDNK